jgi:hypothetical protein
LSSKVSEVQEELIKATSNYSDNIYFKLALMEVLCEGITHQENFSSHIEQSCDNYIEEHPEFEQEEVKKSLAGLAQSCSDLLVKCQLKNLVDGALVCYIIYHLK